MNICVSGNGRGEGQVQAQNGPSLRPIQSAARAQRDRSAKTIDEVFSEYLRRHIVASGSEHSERSVKRVQKLIRKSLGSNFIHTVDSVDMRNCLEPYENQRGNYNLILTYVRAAWNWARQHGVGLTREDTQNPADGIDPKPSTP